MLEVHGVQLMLVYVPERYDSGLSSELEIEIKRRYGEFSQPETQSVWQWSELGFSDQSHMRQSGRASYTNWLANVLMPSI